MDKRSAKLALLVFLFVLTACSGDVYPPPCSQALKGSLTPTCSPPRPGPSVSPVGSWQGTLKTTIGGSGTEPFTAKITEAEVGSTEYAGVFTVGDEVYNVTGYYDFADEGDFFTFIIPLEELEPALSQPPFYGMTWGGLMTETTYSGGWDLTDETDTYAAAGEFVLERLP